MATKNLRTGKARVPVLPTATRTREIDPAAAIEQQGDVKITLGGTAEVDPDDEMVTAIVPKGFRLTLDDHSEVVINAGTQELPLSQASHWFAKANGVQVYDPEA